MVGGEGQRESAALVLDPWLVTPYLATPVAWSGQVAPGAGVRGVGGWLRVGSRVGPRVGPLQTSCSGVFPGPNYALQFPVLTETRKLWEQVGGLPKMELRGKRGSWVVCDLFRLREWKFSGNPGRTAERRPFPLVGKGQGNPWRQGDPEKKTKSSGRGLAGRWSLCRV